MRRMSLGLVIDWDLDRFTVCVRRLRDGGGGHRSCRLLRGWVHWSRIEIGYQLGWNMHWHRWRWRWSRYSVAIHLLHHGESWVVKPRLRFKGNKEVRRQQSHKWSMRRIQWIEPRFRKFRVNCRIHRTSIKDHDFLRSVSSFVHNYWLFIFDIDTCH